VANIVAKGGRRPQGAALIMELDRELGPEDFQHLANAVGSTTPSLLKIRHQHHQLAQLLARGHSQTHASFLSGYSVSRISILLQDPMFQNLVAYYQGTEELAHIEVMERMQALGISTLDELQARMEENPDKFQNRELMELAELTLVKAMQRKAGSGAGAVGSGGGVNINVKFVGAAQAPSGPVIDAEPLDD
jgi:hypothetical protein